MYHKKSNATNLMSLLNDAKQGQDSIVGQGIGSNIGGDQGPFSELELRSGVSAGNPLVNMVMSGQVTKKTANQNTNNNNNNNNNNSYQDNSTLHLRFGVQQGNNTSYEMASQNMYKSNDIMSQGMAQQSQLQSRQKDSAYKRLREFTRNFNINGLAGEPRNSNIVSSKKKRNHVKNYLFIMCLVKKFTNILKTISTTYKFRSMNKKHFEIIGDLSSNYRFFKLSQYLQQDEPAFYEKCWYGMKKFFRTLVWNPILDWQCSKFMIENCYNRIQVIQPESTFKQCWDIFSSIFFVINIFYIPVRVSFSFKNVEEPHIFITFLLYYLPPILLIIEIILNFNTAFYKQGMATSNRSQIFHNYIRSQFLIDFTICFTQILSIILGIVELKAFIIIRYSKVISLLKQIEERLNLNESQTAYLNLFKLIFMIVFIAHICGCSFFLVTKIEKYYGFTGLWTESLQITDYTILQQYITSLYWAVITMITLGYGDITPQNTTERAFVVCITMISCGTFAFSINEIGQIIQQIGKKANEQRKKINMLMSLMQKRGLSNNQLLMKIRRNFQYLLEQNAENNEEGVKFLQQLDLNLKNEVMRDIYGKILSNKKIFQLNFSKGIIENLCLKMKEQTYGPEDIIIKERDMVNCIYFVLQGEAQSYINLASKDKKSQTTSQTDSQISVRLLPLKILQNYQIQTQTSLISQRCFSNRVMQNYIFQMLILFKFDQQVLNIFQKGDIFGEKAFFGIQKSEYGVKARTIVTVAFLSYDDFVECIKEREEDFEKFCFLKDKLQFQNITEGLGIKCFGCSKFTHTIANCPHSKYIPNQYKVLYLNNIVQLQERQYVQRNKPRWGNAVSIQDVIHNSGVKFIMEYIGIEALQQYYEDKEMAQIQYISSLNNIKQHETFYNQQLIQGQMQYQGLSQVDNFGYGGNTSSFMNNSPAIRQQQLKLLQQQMNQQMQDYIISPEQINAQTSTLLQSIRVQQNTNNNNINNGNNNEVRIKELSVIQDEYEKSGGVSDLEDPLIRDRGSSQSGGIQKISSSRFQNEIAKYEQQQQLQQQQNLQQQQQPQLQQQIFIPKQARNISIKKLDSFDTVDQQSSYNGGGISYDQNFQQYFTPRNNNKNPIFSYMKGQGNSQFSQYASNQDTIQSNFRNSISNTPSNNPLAPNNYSNLRAVMHRDSGQIDKEKLAYLQPRQMKNLNNNQKEESADSDENDNKGIKKRLSQSGISNNNILSPELNSQDNQKSVSHTRLRDSSSQWNNRKSFVNLQTINQNWLGKMKEDDRDSFFTINSFDVSKQYKIYYPYYNQSKVIFNYTQQVMKTLQKPSQAFCSLNNKDDIQRMIKSYQSTLQKSPKKRNHTLLDKKSIFTIYKSEGLILKNQQRESKGNDMETSSLKNIDLSSNMNNNNKILSSLNHVAIGESQQFNLEKTDSKFNTMKTKKYNMIENNGYLINQQKEVVKELHKKTRQILLTTEDILRRSCLAFSAQNLQSNSQFREFNSDIQKYAINQQ